MKKLLLIVTAAFLLPACNNDNEQSGDLVSVKIAERSFLIPRGYLDGRRALGKDTESIVLEYSLPGFEVLPPHPQGRLERKKLLMAGRMRSMLLEAEKNRPSLSEAVSMHMLTSSFNRKSELRYGLEHYIHSSGDDDLLIERSPSGEVTSYLRCSPPKKDKIPACRHRFINKSLIYQIGWRIGELKNWRNQRDSAIGFVDSLDVSRNDKEN